MKVLDRWLSVDMGDEIHFDPRSSMWADRVWQNGAKYVCSGIRKLDDCESITDHYDYRFTKIGDASIGDEYQDVFLTGKDIKKWYDNGKVGDIETTAGWFTMAKPTEGSETKD